jgi:hypothetical protein
LYGMTPWPSGFIYSFNRKGYQLLIIWNYSSC